MEAALDGLTLSYGQTEALVRAMHAVPDAKAGPLTARFKYYQRMGFPERSAVGRGSRVGYGLEQVLQLAVAFELMEVGLNPVRIVRTVRTGWPSTLVALLEAHSSQVASDEWQEDDARLLVVHPVAMSELGVDEPASVPVEDPLVPQFRWAFEAWSQDPPDTDWRVDGGRIVGSDRTCTRIAVDPWRLVALVRFALVEVVGLPIGKVDAGFAALGA